MSMPSDVEPEVSEAMERVSRPKRPEPSQLTADHRGWAVAAFVAFLGVAYLGPALARYRRRPTLRERVSRRAQEMRWEAERRGRAAAGKVRKQARRLGGGSTWRRS